MPSCRHATRFRSSTGTRCRHSTWDSKTASKISCDGMEGPRNGRERDVDPVRPRSADQKVAGTWCSTHRAIPWHPELDASRWCSQFRPHANDLMELFDPIVLPAEPSHLLHLADYLQLARETSQVSQLRRGAAIFRHLHSGRVAR